MRKYSLPLRQKAAKNKAINLLVAKTIYNLLENVTYWPYRVDCMEMNSMQFSWGSVKTKQRYFEEDHCLFDCRKKGPGCHFKDSCYFQNGGRLLL